MAVPGKAALLALTLAALAGCSSLPFGAGYTGEESAYGTILPPEAETLEPGAATDAEVLTALGPPSAITALPEGHAFLYEAGRLGSRTIGVSAYHMRAGYSWSEGSFSLGAFVFDADGTLTGRAIERRTDGTGKGFAVGTQHAKSADQLIYMLPAPQHFWPRQMLRRLPATLNEQSDIASGAHGFQRRETTSKVGQRTLESGYLTAIGLLELLKQQTGQ